jgi:hypothetical protein
MIMNASQIAPLQNLPHQYRTHIYQNHPQARSVKEKSKDWLARNLDNVSVWGDMSIRGLSELALKIQLNVSFVNDVICNCKYFY